MKRVRKGRVAPLVTRVCRVLEDSRDEMGHQVKGVLWVKMDLQGYQAHLGRWEVQESLVPLELQEVPVPRATSDLPVLRV